MSQRKSVATVLLLIHGRNGVESLRRSLPFVGIPPTIQPCWALGLRLLDSVERLEMASPKSLG
jgi:hypothetical protein